MNVMVIWYMYLIWWVYPRLFFTASNSLSPGNTYDNDDDDDDDDDDDNEFI